MLTILSIIIIVFIGIVVFFRLPYSKLKSDFNVYTDKYMTEKYDNDDLLKEEDIKKLPTQIQNFYKYTGLLGSPKSSYGKMFFKQVKLFNTDVNKELTIDYTEYISGDTPTRLAFIDTSLYGIPFQGLDSYVENKGGMKGVIGKVYTLFDVKGADMDQASLVTWLGEAIFVPHALLNKGITFEEIDSRSVKVSVINDNITVSGIYNFNEDGSMSAFTTDDRLNSDMNGNSEKVRWSMTFDNYKKNDKGMILPTYIKAIWNYPDKDLIYFDGDNCEFTFK